MVDEQTLREKIQHLRLANDAYSRGQPFLSDTEYHKIWREVRDADPTNPELYHTARDPNYVSTRPHLFTIMGTQKAFDVEELRPFLKRFKDEHLILEPKYDGVAAMLYATDDPERPRLIKFGDGVRGESITHHIDKIQLPALTDRQYLSLEILIPWDKWNPDWGKNPRNVAAGMIARHEIPASLSQVLVGIRHEDGPLSIFLRPPYDPETLASFFLSTYHQWNKIYPMDGLMLKVEDATTRMVAGHNGTVSLWSVAWKPPMQIKWTTVTSIEWNISRSGRVVPRILYEPIELCSTTNTYATGNNAEWIWKNSIHEGARILIGKAGEIIPQIIAVESNRDADLPTNCPVCDGGLDRDGVHLICSSDDCLGQTHKRLVHFCKIEGMNIKAVGPSLLDELLQDQALYKMLKDYPWALLDPEEFGILEKIRSIWGDAYTNQYLNSLEELSGNRNAAHFIAALGYPGLGYKTAMKALQMLKDQKMKSQITTDAAVNFVRAYTTYKLALNDLRNFEFASIPSQSVATYCITGTLSMHRNDMIAWLNKYNWQFVNTVTRHTNYLIVGENNKETVKEKRAKQLRVTIIYEHQLPQLLKETSDERRNDEVDSGDRS